MAAICAPVRIHSGGVRSFLRGQHITIRDIAGLLLPVLVCTICASRALGDAFGSGANAFDIEFVTIGNPGNAADTMGDPNPAGSVAETFRIGKFEISDQMIDKANALGGLGITKESFGADKPAARVTWNMAARFANWLNTSTGNSPAYKFAVQPGEAGYSANANIQLWEPADAGYDATNLFRNSLAKYFLPSVDEWYKAAYFDPVSGVYYDYATGSDTLPDGIQAAGDTAFEAVFFDPVSTNAVPNSFPNDITDVGLLSPYGTAGQTGNVYEWNETEADLINDSTANNRIYRGGEWESDFQTLDGFTAVPPNQQDRVGIRIASTAIPEPSAIALLGVGILLVGRRIRSKAGA